MVELNTVESTEVTEAVEFTFTPGSIEDKLSILGGKLSALAFKQYNLGSIEGKGQYKAAATAIRANTLEMLGDLKDIRRDMLTEKTETLAKMVGIRKTRSKEDLLKEIQAMQERVNKM